MAREVRCQVFDVTLSVTLHLLAKQCLLLVSGGERPKLCVKAVDGIGIVLAVSVAPALRRKARAVIGTGRKLGAYVVRSGDGRWCIGHTSFTPMISHSIVSSVQTSLPSHHRSSASA